MITKSQLLELLSFNPQILDLEILRQIKLDGMTLMTVSLETTHFAFGELTVPMILVDGGTLITPTDWQAIFPSDLAQENIEDYEWMVTETQRRVTYVNGGFLIV